MPSFWRTLLTTRPGASPRPPLPLATERDVFVAGLACVLCGWLGDCYAREPDMLFTWSALGAYAVLVVLLRLAGAISAQMLRRPAIAPTLAAWMLLASAPLLFVVNATQATLLAQRRGADLDPEYGFGVFAWIMIPVVAVGMLAEFRRFVWPATRMQRLLVALVIPAAAFLLVEKSDTWSAFYYSDYEESSEVATTERADVALDYDPEDLLAMQDGLVDAQIAALAPQRPGVVDLYLVAMAGDGAEDVFRNEVVLATTVFDERFGTRGRSLSLINHVDTLPQVPLATRRNLLRTLEGVGRLIDPDEDIVLVFMTSHGSEDQDWLVQLGDLSLTQIVPDDLLEAYDNAGIRWRVSIVSACYSGGYIDALASATSLVITSARADRPSFGCGADADLTYFGRAYLAEALATHTNLVAAFETARQRIEARERADGFDPSEPQIRLGEGVGAQLARWRAGLDATVRR